MFAEQLDQIVRESNAFENDFFANCKDTSKQPSIYNMAAMAVNWYGVTKHFGLCTPEYTAILARRRKTAYGKKAELLEQLLVESARISSDDLGIGHENLYDELGGAQIPSHQRIHYKLWGEMAKALIRAARKQAIPNGCTGDERDRLHKVCQLNPDYVDEINIVNADDIGLFDNSTYELVERIEDEFTSIEGGVVVYQVVESTAFNIVTAYSDVMNRLRCNEKPLFTERELVYLEIHKPLEREHDRQSTRMMEVADQYFGERYRLVLETKVRELSTVFFHFWCAMNEIVFKGEPKT